MAAADRIIGSGVVVHFLPTGGTPGVDEKVLTADFTSFDWNRQVDVVDVTAGNEQERYEKDTIEALDFTIMMFDADPTYLSAIKPRSNGKLTVYKEGIGSGKAKMSFNMLFTGYNETHPFDGALEIELTGVRRGAMVDEIGTVQA